MIMLSDTPAGNPAEVPVYEARTLYQVPIDLVREDPDQPRKSFRRAGSRRNGRIGHKTRDHSARHFPPRPGRPVSPRCPGFFQNTKLFDGRMIR